MFMNRRMRNRTYGGVRGRRGQLRPLLDAGISAFATISEREHQTIKCGDHTQVVPFAVTYAP